jgi:hypothetical protein
MFALKNLPNNPEVSIPCHLLPSSQTVNCNHTQPLQQTLTKKKKQKKETQKK